MRLTVQIDRPCTRPIRSLHHRSGFKDDCTRVPGRPSAFELQPCRIGAVAAGKGSADMNDCVLPNLGAARTPVRRTVEKRNSSMRVSAIGSRICTSRILRYIDATDGSLGGLRHQEQKQEQGQGQTEADNRMFGGRHGNNDTGNLFS